MRLILRVDGIKINTLYNRYILWGLSINRCFQYLEVNGLLHPQGLRCSMEWIKAQSFHQVLIE